jgi:RNA polymerase sigma factor (TIGR02999 family)
MRVSGLCQSSAATIFNRMSEVTRLLTAIEQGDSAAASQLLPLVYDELRRLAARQLAQERAGHTLQATALVHEAYLRLVGTGEENVWEGHRHFFAAAAEAMRRILVENARRKKRLKRGGNLRRVDLLQAEVPDVAPSDDLLALDEALDLLAKEDPQKAELVKLRFFAGLSIEEAACYLGVSRATANRHWAYARAWLYEHVRDAAD